MATEPDSRIVRFAQARTNALADAVNNLIEQLKFTNSHVERLSRDIGYLKADLSQTRTEMVTRFDRVDRELQEVRGDVILQANQILNAQQDARQSLRRIEDLLEEAEETSSEPSDQEEG